MKCLTLLTDFGLRDAFVGMMKGVIYGIAPDVRIVDISHHIQPQNILQGAVVLADSYRFFPPGSIHLAVVDPGVGTARAGMAAQIGEHFFVAPDNGLLSGVLEGTVKNGEAVRAFRLENNRYWLARISRTFHGRDIFAPVAAHLANGIPLEAFGHRLDNPVRIDIPRAERTETGWLAEVLMSDIFGNVITSLTDQQLGGAIIEEVQIGGVKIWQVSDTYGEAESGALIALIDSSGRLSISQVNGSAVDLLGARVGDRVEVTLGPVHRS